MGKISLANKYRPKTFEDVSEQDSIKVILENQIKTNDVKHAYLFCGGAGTGKTTTARIIANMINNGMGKPIEMDCASHNGVDDMRMIQEECKTRPLAGKYKIFILDECHMITVQGWNSMLKILEEPPEYVVFMFCLTGDGLVQTPNGLKYFKDIKPGDYVWSGEKYVKVTKFFNNGIRDILKITLDGGRVIKCTPNHKLFVLREGVEQWIEAQDVKVTDNICVYHSTYKDRQDCPVLTNTMCSFLGYMMGNGRWGSTSMEFYTPPHKMDKVNEILTRGVKEGWLRGFKHNPPRTGNSYTTQIYFKYGYRKIWNKQMGLYMYNRTELKVLPDVVYQMSKNQFIEFMNGWFLADGSSISDTFLPSKSTGMLYSNNSRVVYELQNICTTFGIDLSVLDYMRYEMNLPGERHIKRKYHTYNLRCKKQSGYFNDDKLKETLLGDKNCENYNEIKRILNAPHRKINPYILNSSNQEELKGNKWFVSVKKIESFGKQQVFDIEVPETNYFIYNGVKVHNCTTDPQKIIGTILSRVQRFNFSRISTQGIINRLTYIINNENKDNTPDLYINYEPQAIEYIARLARGGMRDSITTLEKCLDYSRNLTLVNVLKVTSGGVDEDTLRLFLQNMLNRDCKTTLLQFNDIYMTGVDVSLFLKMYTEFLENCVKYLITENANITTLSQNTISWLQQQSMFLQNIRQFLLSVIRINKSYSSEDLKIMVESWIIQECS